MFFFYINVFFASPLFPHITRSCYSGWCGVVWSGVVVACFQFRIQVLQPAGVLFLLVVIGKVAAVVAVVAVVG